MEPTEIRGSVALTIDMDRFLARDLQNIDIRSLIKFVRENRKIHGNWGVMPLTPSILESSTCVERFSCPHLVKVIVIPTACDKNRIRDVLSLYKNAHVVNIF